MTKSTLKKRVNYPAFKACIRETSVYQYIVELKEDVLTPKGFLDIVKVPKLYMCGAGRFLRKLRLKQQLRLKDVAKLIGVTTGIVSSWESNRKRISLKSLVKIAQMCRVSKETIYLMIENGEITFKTHLPIRLEKIRKIFPISLLKN